MALEAQQVLAGWVELLEVVEPAEPAAANRKEAAVFRSIFPSKPLLVQPASAILARPDLIDPDPSSDAFAHVLALVHRRQLGFAAARHQRAYRDSDHEFCAFV